MKKPQTPQHVFAELSEADLKAIQGGCGFFGRMRFMMPMGVMTPGSMTTGGTTTGGMTTGGTTTGGTTTGGTTTGGTTTDPTAGGTDSSQG